MVAPRDRDAPLVELRGVSKSYPGVRALRGVDLDVLRGQVHAVVGENGAGKSTLAKILAGAVRHDEGSIRIAGADIGVLTPARSLELGIGTCFQEVNLVPQLTVAENLFFGHLPTRRGFIDRRELQRSASELLTSMGIDLDPAATAAALSIAEQQLVEFARSASLTHALLITDEPTASLTETEADALFAVISRVVERGVAVLYISHRLDEVLRIAQRVTVLRDGARVATLAASEVTRDDLVRMMVGREITDLYPKQPREIREPVLELVRLRPRGASHSVDLSVRGGEIVGVFGLVGSGRTELAHAICGLDPAESGEVRVRGRPLRIASVQDALRAGIVLIPEDRKRVGLILSQSVRENLVLPNLRRFLRLGLLSAAREREFAERQVDSLKIRTPGTKQRVINLSGGNQQKVVIGKWLGRALTVLIADEPTRGIDIATKAQVHALLSDLAAQGVAILMISSELPEILGMSDRVVVFHEGGIAGCFRAREATPERVMQYATGGDDREIEPLAEGVPSR